MSGFEVAGVMLGSFPLIISALEHYRDVAEVWGTFWKFRREYDHWIHQLKVCRLAFEQNLEEFLLPLVVEDDELTALLADPGGPEWKNPDLEIRLRERLPKSYDLYLESMARVERVMTDVRKRLNLEDADFQDKLVVDTDGANQTPDGLLTRIAQLSINESKAVIKFQTQRIKMSLGQAKRDKLFHDLSDCNTELRSLLDTSDRIAALRQARDTSRKSKAATAAGKALWQFWRHADRLYSLITRAWTCECRKFHLANLLLQHRTSPKVDFRVLFVFAPPREGAGGGGGGWSWTCQETRIDLLENPKPRSSRAPAVRFVSAPAAVTSSCSLPMAVVSATAAPLTPANSDASGTARTPSPAPSFPCPTGAAVPSKSSFRKTLMGKFKKGHKKDGSITLVQISSAPVSPSPVQSPPATVVTVTPAIAAPTATTATATSPPAATPQAPPVPVIVTPTLTPSSSNAHEDDLAAIDIINLCETMAKLPKGKNTAPACLTDDEEDTRFAINPVSNPTAVRDTVSLEALLTGHKAPARQKAKKRPDIALPPLTRRERYFIALTLASSYLQLHSSPWISPRWNKREILFLRDPACPGGVVLDQPYISRDFLEGGGSETGNGCDPGCTSLPTAARGRGDYSLASLGIMLLELCFGTTVESHEMRRLRLVGFGKRKKKGEEKAGEGGDEEGCYEPEGDGDDEPMLGKDTDDDELDPDTRWFLDMAAALHWSQRAAGEAGPDFAEAVEWCLKSKPGSGENDGSLDKWREEMFLKVVTPLKYCYDQLVTVRC